MVYFLLSDGAKELFVVLVDFFFYFSGTHFQHLLFGRFDDLDLQKLESQDLSHGRNAAVFFRHPVLDSKLSSSFSRP